MRFRGFFEHKLIIAKEIQQRIDDSAGLGINASALYNYQCRQTDKQNFEVSLNFQGFLGR